MRLVFWWLSLSPSLAAPRLDDAGRGQRRVPRRRLPASAPGSGWAYHAMLHRRRPHDRAARLAARCGSCSVSCSALVVIAGLALWTPWQNDQRALVQLADLCHSSSCPDPPGHARRGRRPHRDRAAHRPRHRLASTGSGARLPKASRLTSSRSCSVRPLLDRRQRLVVDTFFDWANRCFGTFDTETPPGIVQPTSTLRSGGPGSLCPWDTLGYEGRNFTGGGPAVTTSVASPARRRRDSNRSASTAA